jgi:hypothetical protein
MLFGRSINLTDDPLSSKRARELKNKDPSSRNGRRGRGSEAEVEVGTRREGNWRTLTSWWRRRTPRDRAEPPGLDPVHGGGTVGSRRCARVACGKGAPPPPEY